MILDFASFKAKKIQKAKANKEIHTFNIDLSLLQYTTPGDINSINWDAVYKLAEKVGDK